MKRIFAFLASTVFGSVMFGQTTKADSTIVKSDTLKQPDTIIVARKVLPSEMQNVRDSTKVNRRQTPHKDKMVNKAKTGERKSGS